MMTMFCEGNRARRIISWMHCNNLFARSYVIFEEENSSHVLILIVSKCHLMDAISFCVSSKRSLHQISGVLNRL